MLFWLMSLLGRVPGVLPLALWFEERLHQREVRRWRAKKEKERGERQQAR